MCNRSTIPLMVVAIATWTACAGCDRLTTQSLRDGGPDSLASLWQQVEVGTVNYNAVAGSDPENVFIVGDQGTILHWDGIALVPEVSGTTANLRGVSVVNTTLAYAVGERGTILHRQDGAWIVDPPMNAAVLNATYAASAFALAVGEQGTILIYRQGVWSQVPNLRTDNYYAVANANDGLQVVGALGVVVRVDPGAGTIVNTASIQGYTKVLAGAVPYASGSLFVGVDGGFYYWANGVATNEPRLPKNSPPEGFPPQRFLRAISVVGSTVWIVGHEGLVVTGTLDAPMTLVPTPDDRWLLGVYAASATDVWVVGRSGLIMRGPPGARGPFDGGAP
jgi:photosystem II stability/assembly factor-like uncharacterized protein